MRLSERDRATIAALAAVILPPGGRLPSAEDVGTAEAVAATIDTLPPTQAERLVAVVRAFSALPLTYGRARRFRRLSPAARESFVGRVSRTEGYRRQLFAALKQLVVTTWASHPRVSAALGYDAGCVADDDERQAFVRTFLPVRDA